jgi:hypothetical protein
MYMFTPSVLRTYFERYLPVVSKGMGEGGEREVGNGKIGDNLEKGKGWENPIK